MKEYETQILIDELESLIVSKTLTIKVKDIEIGELKERIKFLEEMLQEKNQNK